MSGNLTVMRLVKHPCKARTASGSLCGDIWRAVTFSPRLGRHIATRCIAHEHECDASGKHLVPVQLTLDGCLQ